MFIRKSLLAVALTAALAAVAISLGSPGFAQVEQEYLSEGPILIRNVTVIDGLGNDPVAGQDILIEDGKIAKIAETGAAATPSGAIEIDGAGLTAIPGLIDMHFHLKGGWSGGNALQEKYPPSSFLTHKAIQQGLGAMLYAGVTTGLDMGSTHSFIASLLHCEGKEKN